MAYSLDVDIAAMQHAGSAVMTSGLAGLGTPRVFRLITNDTRM